MAKWPFCKGFSKATLTYFGVELKSKSHIKKSQHMKEIFYGKNGSKKHLQSGKISHFAKATASQNGQRWSILSFNFKVPKTYKRNSVYINIIVILYNKGLKNMIIF